MIKKRNNNNNIINGTNNHLLGRCSAMMMARYSIFGSYLMDITEFQQVQPHTLLTFAKVSKRFM